MAHRGKFCESELVEEIITPVLSHASQAKSNSHCIKLKSISKLAEFYCATESHHSLQQAEGTVGSVSTSCMACVHCWLSFSILQPASNDGSLPSKAASWSHVSCAQAISRLLLPAQHTAHKASEEAGIYSKHQQPHDSHMYAVPSFSALVMVMGRTVASVQVLNVCRPTQLADAC